MKNLKNFREFFSALIDEDHDFQEEHYDAKMRKIGL